MRVSIPDLAKLFATLAAIFGIFSPSAQGQGATYKIVAFTDQTAPGGGTYYHFDAPRIGADGTVSFVESDSRSEGSLTSIYAGLPGSLRRVVSKGDVVPDVEGSFYADFGDLSVSQSGSVAFNAGITGDGYLRGIWSESSAGLSESSGDQGRLDVVSIGSVAFRSGTAFAKGQFVPFSEVQFDEGVTGALLKDLAGSFDDVLREGQSIGGRRIQKIYDSDGDENGVGSGIDMNESGAVVLKMAVAPSASPTPYPNGAIYAGDPAKPQLVAEQGDAAPGLSDTSYGDLSARPSIASNGLVAFTSSLSSESGPNSAVFSGLPGALVPRVLEDSLVPTTTNVTFGALSDAVVNATGDVIFRARIRYPNGSSRVGIWIQRQTESPVLIAISGMNLPTPSGMHEVTNVDFAGPGTFNDLHEFVFKAEFDGDQGVYVADTRPGAPTVHIVRPNRPRDFVTRATSVKVAGTASDETGVERVEYTVSREVSASKKKNARKRGQKLVTSRPKIAAGRTSWNFNVPLSMGLNLISITAIDKLGNRSEPYQVRMLRYELSE